MYTLYHPDTLNSGGGPSFAIHVIKIWGERVYATNRIDLMQWNFSARENALKFLQERKKPRLAFTTEWSTFAVVWVPFLQSAKQHGSQL